jgi:hypothetical protein
MLLAALFMACGEGEGTADATEHCQGQRDIDTSGCWTDEAFQACVACREECGEACALIDTASPCAFTCPAE